MNYVIMNIQLLKFQNTMFYYVIMKIKFQNFFIFYYNFLILIILFYSIVYKIFRHDF